MGSVAAKVAIHKRENPHRYCPKCLWRTEGGPCWRHTPLTAEQRAEIKSLVLDEGYRQADATRIVAAGGLG
jgi:hypothetical protein